MSAHGVSTERSHGETLSVCGLLLLAVAVLLTSPYSGIRHDSILYLGQALRAFVAPQLDNDLFFASGSQATFTLFPVLVGRVLAFVPAGELFLVGTFLGRVAFLWASWSLLRRLFLGK